MEPDSVADLLLGLLRRLTRGDAAGEIRHISRIVALRLFDHNRVTHHGFSLRPACFNMLFNVPGAKSCPGLPAIVTRPGLIGCRNWRWLPLVATWTHPSSPISLMTSRTFKRDPTPVRRRKTRTGNS